ncbi:hypothetical protein INR49_029517 [Caranx melampygus]|nr:hypothetical protein INR49_029517 [Caranx melampygus]
MCLKHGTKDPDTRGGCKYQLLRCSVSFFNMMLFKRFETCRILLPSCGFTNILCAGFSRVLED